MHRFVTVVAASSSDALPLLATHWMWMFPVQHAFDAIILAVRTPHKECPKVHNCGGMDMRRPPCARMPTCTHTHARQWCYLRRFLQEYENFCDFPEIF
jgi:hypothetical protein